VERCAIGRIVERIVESRRSTFARNAPNSQRSASYRKAQEFRSVDCHSSEREKRPFGTNQNDSETSGMNRQKWAVLLGIRAVGIRKLPERTGT
jgi:hypothetical protein